MSRDGWLAVLALNGLIAVAAGAFAAHGLEASGPPADAVELMQTAALYQMWHGLALLALRAMGRGRWTGWFFLTGIVLFSGSLYGLALGGPRGLAYVTPFGGLAFLLGWGVLAVRALGLGAKRRRYPAAWPVRR